MNVQVTKFFQYENYDEIRKFTMWIMNLPLQKVKLTTNCLKEVMQNSSS